MYGEKKEQEILTQLPPVGDLPLIAHPDVLQSTWKKLQVFRLEPEKISSGLFLSILFKNLGVEPWLFEYPFYSHGTDDPRRWPRRCQPEEVTSIVINWPEYQKGLTEKTILGIASLLEDPQFTGERQSFLLLDLEGEVGENTLKAIEAALITNKFPGGIACSGASYHYISLFRVPALIAHCFQGRLIRILTPPTAPAAPLYQEIGQLLEKAKTYREAQEIARAILNNGSRFYVPSIADGFYSGSNVDARHVAHKILDDTIRRGAGVLRISEQPERIIPYINSLILPKSYF